MANLEQRYLVLKLKHVENLDGGAIRSLLEWLKAHNSKLPKLDCVVIERDWPEFQLSKDLVLARAGEYEGKVPPLDNEALAGYLKLLVSLARSELAKGQLTWLSQFLMQTPEQHAEDAMQDPAEQLVCAEDILDSYAAELSDIPTEYGCIGDYITAVVEAYRKKVQS